MANVKCVFVLSQQILSETFLILRGIQRDMIKNPNKSTNQMQQPLKFIT